MKSFFIFSLLICSLSSAYSTSHKKRVVKKSVNERGIIKKVKYCVFYDDNGKKSFKGPIQIREIENSSPDLLTIELDSKNINGSEKFTPFKAKYKVFDPEVNFRDRSGKTKAQLYEIDGLKRFDVDISELPEGEHELFVRIVSYKTKHLKKSKRPRKKFVHKASIRFIKNSSDVGAPTLEILPIDLLNRDFLVQIGHDDPNANIIRSLLSIISPLGNGTQYETGESIQLNLAEAGVYGFMLTVQYADGTWSEPVFSSYEVLNQIPVADFSITQISADRIYLVADGSYDLDGNLIDAQYLFIGPNNVSFTRSILGDYEVLLPYAGEWSVELVVLDNDFASSETVTRTVTVENLSPIADFNIYPAGGAAPLTVQLDASLSVDPDTQIDQYLWEISDGENLSGIAPSYIFEEEGTYSITLTVVDSEGAYHSTTKGLEVLPPANQLPIASFTYSPERGEFPLNVNFDASNSSDPDNDNLSFSWAFEDGTTLAGVTVSKTFNVEGPHKVELTVTDDRGGSTLKEETIFLYNTHKEMQISASGYQDESGAFLGGISFDIIDLDIPGNLENINWDMGDGDTYSGISFLTHRFEEIGEYTVQLTITDDLGNTENAELLVRLVNLENPNEVPSQYEVSVQGIDEKVFNPIQNNIEITLSEGGIFASDTRIYLNEADITADFILNSENTSFSGTINATNDENILEIKGYDQNDNLIDEELVYLAGANNISLSLKDLSGNAVDNFALDIKTGYGELFDFKLATDANGNLSLTNLPDTKLNISGIDDRGYLVKNDVSSTNTQIDLELSTQRPVSSVDNSKLVENLNGWEITNGISNLVAVNETNALRLEIDGDLNSQVSHTYRYLGETKFLSHQIEFPFIDINHEVSISIINHTKNMIESYLRSSSDLSEQNLAIYAENDDVISIELNFESNSQGDSVFHHFMKSVNRSISAYAAELSIIQIYPRVESGHSIKSAVLTDLNRAIQKREGQGGYNLTPLAKLSIGSYTNGFNNIYSSIKVSSVTPSRFILRDVQMFQNSVDMSDKIALDDVNLINGRALTRESIDSPFYELNHYSRSDGKVDYEEGNDIASFTPTFKILNNSLSPNYDVEIFSNFTIEHIDPITNTNYTEFGVLRIVIKKEDLLIDHGIRDNNNRHYCHDKALPDCSNEPFPDNGDDWIAPYLFDTYQSIYNDTTLRFGDASNVNGVYKPEKKSPYIAYFQPHKSHQDGQNLDAISTNLKEETGFNSAVVEDIHDFIRQSPQLKNNLELIGVTRIQLPRKKNEPVRFDPDYAKLYEHSCVEGKILTEVIPKTPYGGHNDHYHFEFTDNYAESAFANPQTLSNNYTITSEILPADSNGSSKRAVYKLSGLNYEKYMIQLFERSKDGKYTEHVRKYKDENYLPLPFRGIDGVSISLDADTSELVLTVDKTLDLSMLDQKYFFRLSQVDGSGCVSTKLLPSQIFNTIQNNLNISTQLLYKRAAGVDVKVSTTSAFDSIKVIKSSTDYETGIKTELDTLEFTSLEGINAQASNVEVIANSLSFDLGLDFPDQDSSFVKAEVCLFGICKSSLESNYSRFGHVLRENGTLTASSANPFGFTVRSSYTISYTNGFASNDLFGDVSCSATDVLISPSFGVNYNIGGDFRASFYYQDGEMGFYRFYFYCDTIISGSPVQGDYGTNGSIIGVTTIELEDSPLFAPDVERVIGISIDRSYK